MSTAEVAADFPDDPVADVLHGRDAAASTRRRPASADIVITIAGLIVLVIAAVSTGRHLNTDLSHDNYQIVLAYVLAMAVGERLRIELPGRAAIGPLATATALAFAMTQPVAFPDTTTQPTSYGWGIVVVGTAVAMVLGEVPRVVRGRRFSVLRYGPRLLAVAVAALAYRKWVGVWFGKTAMAWVREQVDEGLRVAIVMVLVAGLALLVELLVSTASDAARDHASYRRTLQDSVRALSGLAAALAATAALVVLAFQPLKLYAIPLLLLPLALTEIGVRRYADIRANYRQTIVSLSRLTAISGYTAEGHPERVASLCVAIGRDLGMSEREITDLEYAALLHDIGQVGLLDPIPRGATVMAAPTDQRRVATAGAHIVRETGVLDTVATILETQATSYRQTREFGEDLPLASRIIKVVNAFDDLSEGSSSTEARASALERIHLGLGYEYDPRVVDSLSLVLTRIGL